MGPLSIAAIGWLMGSLINKAVTEMLEAWAKRQGLGKEFKTLKDQLLQLDARLTSANSLQTNNRFLKELVQNLQHLAYQAQNLLDELDYYRLEDQIKQRVNILGNCRNKSLVASSYSGYLLASHPIISTLEGLYFRSAPYAPVPLPETTPSKINLSRRMNELAEQLQKSEEEVRKAVNTEISQTEATNLRQTSSFLNEPSVFGRDQERDQVKNLLKNEESTIVGTVTVLAIVGTGGVGKTTLARLVFNDPEVASYFKVRLWICVSTRFDIVRLTREMLEGAGGNRCDLSNLNELQNELKNKLYSKRFLLVLDDMWEDKDKSQWESMVSPLNYCRWKGGIILVTTRNQSVAKMINARDISLRGIEKNDFLSFFSTCIFNDPNYGGYLRLRDIGEEIANKLKGNPLAAKTVSALLKENLDERYWMKIRDSEEWKSQNGPNDILPALRLSYEHMPFHLQRCFSYCAIFPEDHSFTRTDLVYLWMAQGFLDERSEGKRMEDIGSAYFNDLFNRGFFQTKQSTYDHKVRYTFHDLIHDLAHMVAFKECLTINGPKPRQIPSTIRHLSIEQCWAINEAEPEEPIVRPLACLEGKKLSTLLINWDYLPSGIFRSILDLLKETKFLRAVRITLRSEVQTQNFNFQNLVSLRYLRIRTFGTLPGEICKLYHLEVLHIERGSILKKLPDNFSELVSLRHFNVERGNFVHDMICGVGKLTSLQKLNHFKVQQKKGFEIEQLGSLKEIGGSLHIWSLQNVKSKGEANMARLSEKEKLDALYLLWNYDDGETENVEENLDELAEEKKLGEGVLEGLKPNINLKLLHIGGYGGVDSPTWLDPSLIFLESLTLVDCKAWKVLPPIGELEFLKILVLSGMATRVIGPQCYGTRESMKFPSLEELWIEDMLDLKKWVWSDQCQQFLRFKKLKKITIRDCPKLVDLPLSECATFELLERFPSLEILKIENCPEIFQLPPLPYSAILSYISIQETKFIKSMRYEKKRQSLNLTLDENSSLEVVEVLAFHELSSLLYLDISNIPSLQSLGLHSFVALKKLVIKGCKSLTSLTFGEHLVNLTTLEIISCKTLTSIKGLKTWVNMRELHFRECPGFIAAWDTALKEIQSTEPDFSLSLIEINGDSVGLLTLPICKQLTSLQIFELEFSAFTEEHEISPQLLTSLELVDISGCKNLRSFPFGLFPSLEELRIKFPGIKSLPTDSCTEITEECKKIRNIKDVCIFDIDKLLVQIQFEVSSEEMICQQMDADN